MTDIREQIAGLHEWGEANNEPNQRASRFFRDTADTMEKMLAVVEAAVLFKDASDRVRLTAIDNALAVLVLEGTSQNE